MWTTFITVIAGLVSASVAFASGNSGITYQGRIIKPDGSPLAGANVQFRMQLRTPNTNNCLMYEEVQAIDMRNSAGVFSLTINDGSGSRTDTTGLGLDRIFANRGSFTFDPTTCSSGSSYSPSDGDGRSLVVLFKDETMSTWEPIPAAKINYVPFAFSSQAVQGYGADSLLRVVNGSGDPLTGLAPLSNAQYTELLALANGTSTNYTKTGQLNGVALPTMNSGEVLGWNGTAWVSSAAPLPGANTITTAMIQSGAVTTSQIANNVSINTSGTLGAAVTTTRDFKIYAASPSTFYIDMQAPALTGSYSLVWPLTAGTANQVLTTDGSGNLSWSTPAASGITALTGDVTASGTGSVAATVALVGTSTAANVHTAEVLANAATAANTSGAIVKRDGSGNFAANVATLNGLALNNGGSILNIVNPVGGAWTMTLPQTAGTSGYALTTNGSGTTSWSPVLTSSNGFVNGGNTFGANSSLGNNDNFDLNVLTNGTPRMTVTAAGNVGIGTTSPTFKLDVAGDLAVWSGGLDGSSSQKFALKSSSTGGWIEVPKDSSNNPLNFAVGWRGGNIPGKGITMLGASGNVGIGTTSPGYKLDVAGAVNATQLLINGVDVSSGAGAWTVSGSNVYRATGNVGVGTSSPAAALTVQSATANAFSVGANGATNPGLNVDASASSAATGINVVSNAAGSNAVIKATSSGTNEHLALYPKGSGSVLVNNLSGSNSAKGILTVNNFGTGASLEVYRDTQTVGATNAIDITLKDSAAANAIFAQVNGGIVTGTHNAQDGFLSLSTAKAGAVTEAMRVDQNGNVGIGTTSPGYKLDVAGAVNATALKINGVDVSAGGSSLWTQGGAGSYYSGTGNVGIGTTSPNYPLTVNGNVYSNGTFTATWGTTSNPGFTTTGGTGFFQPAAGSMGLVTSNTERVRIDSSGNVGIGTTSTAAKLEVVQTTDSAGYGLKVSNSAGSRSGFLWVDSSLNTHLDSASAGTSPLVLNTGGGNVGIGTTSPTEELSVVGTVQVNAKSATDNVFLSGVDSTGYQAAMIKENSNSGMGGFSMSGYRQSNGEGVILNGYRASAADGSIAAIRFNGALATDVTGASSSALVTAPVATFTNNGTELMRIAASGNVGIGTTSPGYKLDVAGAVNATALKINGVDVSAGGSSLWTQGGAGSYYSGTGNVGIGTTSPGTALDVAGTIRGTGLNIGTTVNLSNSASEFRLTDSTTNSFMTFYTNNGSTTSEAVRINGSGNVGIGTTSPGYKLDVAGDVNVTGSFKVNGVNIATGGGDFMKDGSVAMTGALPAAVGTKTAPGYTFSGNTNTGFYHPSADAIGIVTGGADAIRVTSAGDVGVGTTAPGAKFDVSGLINSSTGVMVGGWGTLDRSTTLNINQTSGAYGVAIYPGSSGAAAIYVQNGTGAVGIGTTSPGAGYVMDVNGTLNATGLKINGVSVGTGSGDFKADGSVPMTGQLLANYGNNNNPGYGFSGDPDTGMYHSATNQLSFATAGNTAVTVSSSGNVGIGTTSPASILDIRQSTTGTATIGLTNPNSGSSAAAAFTLTNDLGHSASLQFGSSTFAPTILRDTALFASGTGFGILTNNTVTTGGSGPITFTTGGSTNTATMTITPGNTGNVGIGTTSPAYKLDVAGDVNVTGNFKVNGDNISTGGGGTPGGSTTQIQFNNAGAFGGDAKLIWDNTNKRLGINAATPSAMLSVSEGNTDNIIGGRAFMGGWSGGTTEAAFGHYNNIGSNTGFAIRQSDTGRTVVNSESGNEIQFAIANTEKMRMASNGNVGIGTTSPSQPLHVSGNARFDSIVYFGGTTSYISNSGPTIRFGNGSAASPTYSYSGDNKTGMFMPASGSLAFATSNGGTGYERLRIDTNGNVGIGTTSPYGRVNVQGSSTAAGSMSITNSDWVTGSAGSILGIQLGATSGSTYANITAGTAGGASTGNIVLNSTGGNVGIGTTAPGYKLDVNGQVNIADNTYLSFGGIGALLSGASVPTKVRSNTSQGLSFVVNAGTIAQTIDSSGNVGIGTTSPGYKLDVAGTIRSSTGGIVFPDGTTQTTAAGGGGTGQWGTSGSNVYYTAGNVGIGTTAPGSFVNTSSSFMRPDPSGRFADIYSPANEAVLSLVSGQSAAGAHLGGIYFDRGAGQTDAHTNVASIQARQAGTGTTAGADLYFFTKYQGSGISTDAANMVVTSAGYVGVGTTAPTAKLEVSGGLRVAGGTGGPGTHGITFGSPGDTDGGITSPADGILTLYTNNAERMRIDGSGNVGIGTTAPGQALEVNGSVLAAAYLYSSDRRLKKDITPLENSLEKLLTLNTVKFNWISPKNETEERTQIGLIAQDVQKVFPEAVVEDKQGWLRMNYQALISPVIDGMRDLYNKMMGLDARTKALEQEVASLKSQNSQMKIENKALEDRLSKIEQSLSRQPASDKKSR